MKGIKRGALVTAFLGLVLWACVGLLVGCKDLFHPEGPAEYTVTFNADNGSSGDFKKVTVKHGDSVGGAMPANPSRMGYTFDGWWTSRNGGGSQFTASTTVTGNITVYAKWTATTAVQYTVTFNLDGGNINGNSASVAVVVNSGDSVGGAMPANPSKSGYTFGGWYTQRNGGGSQFTASTTVSADRTVYARWTTGTGISYTVTFDADGGSPATQTRAVNSGASIGGAMPANPSKSGYTFDGWYTQRNGGGSQFTASTIVTAGITVYAKWTATTAVQYTVTFNLDGGNIDGNSASVAVIVNIGASTGGAMPAQPDKSGYTFDGWYTQQNGGGSQFTASTTVTGNITVYAKWTAGSATQYTVTFNADGGSPATQTQTVNSGASLGGGMPSNPSKSGYDFGGWWTSQNGGGARFTADTTVNANITVYAKWVEALPGNLSLEASLTWLASNAAEGGNYTITVSADETLAPKSLSYSGKNVSITLIGNSTERMIRLSSSGSLFTVGSGVTLTLGNNITLQGRSDNSSSLVQVNSGTLVMESGSKITGNTSSYGGGVYVSSGTFTMSGGEISGNTASCGGGVYVSSGTFTMSGGEISGNTASSSGGVD
jgi:uncharacterized repeat protein (TIGR02543 family)